MFDNAEVQFFYLYEWSDNNFGKRYQMTHSYNKIAVTNKEYKKFENGLKVKSLTIGRHRSITFTFMNVIIVLN